MTDFDQSKAIIKRSNAKFHQIEKLLYLVWDTKENHFQRYESAQDLINDTELIAEFKKEINNEMDEKEITEFIRKYCYDEFDEPEEIDPAVDQDEGKDDDETYHKLEDEYIDFRENKLNFLLQHLNYTTHTNYIYIDRKHRQHHKSGHLNTQITPI